MTHGSLFSGIGGFELAAEWMGWENKFHCEWNEFGQKVLHHYWPESEQFTDIKKSNFTKYANQIDILTGGFPCQPYSSAGKRLGKEDERHLWPEMLRAIREINPTYIVGENVRGLLNWNGGLVFNEICSELETNGYQVAPCLIPACGVNAPHRRERIWFIAINTNYQRCKESNLSDITNGTEFVNRKFDETDVTNTECNGKKQNGGTIKNEAAEIWGEKEGDVFGGCSENEFTTNSASTRGRKNNRERKSKLFNKNSKTGNWENFPTQSPICNGDDGFPSRLDGITFSKWRNESIKAAGNAIVPQVALQIFKAIEQYDKAHGCKP
jgi:DNA (cytosine-5)-methyltransferase 1